ncbi:MAG: response regulator [Archangiaceae bacterium]|nr:response regulator [Archangiaceae bacterium]
MSERAPEMEALIAGFDWSSTPLGPIERWSPALRTVVKVMTANRFPQLLWWGPELVSIYNDAYRPVLGTKHPWALGRPVAKVWHEIWHVLRPLIETPLHGGPATWNEDILLEINRHGFVEESHFTIAYSPVPDESAPNGIGGVLATVSEITGKHVAERRTVALRDLGARLGEAQTAVKACEIAASTLEKLPRDLPFSLIYLLDDDGRRLRLAAAAGTEPGTQIAPQVVERGGPQAWPFDAALTSGGFEKVNPLSSRFSEVPQGPWADPPDSAVVAPLSSNVPGRPAGVMVLGLSARLPVDEQYGAFLQLVCSQVSSAIGAARALEGERRRAETLAELDRAKTAFFSNVSHEFRTPLTLMLGPIDDGLADTRHPLPAEQRERLELVQRNGLRLQKLVNSLLDFARIEAGRSYAQFSPTDLCALTRELASSFRSALEHAGLKLEVDCEALPGPVWVDAAMWEKIVLNLLSNAFKFTFNGTVRLALEARGEQVELRVSDTGIGIAREAQARIFERFYRVEGARGRSHEGSGIGLALVSELVKLHGGSVTVQSAPGEGSTFTVTLPMQQARTDAPVLAPTPIRAGAFLAELSQWDGAPRAPAREERDEAPPPRTLGSPDARILVADDNADMRAYLSRLLTPHWQVVTVSDGQQALEAARAGGLDLVLSDVMMPRLDGLKLLETLRADPRTRGLPVVLLSARAGEEATVAGLQGGADDYLVKPFSSHELLARVSSQLALAALRKQALTEAQLHGQEAGRLLESSRQAIRSRDEVLAVVSHDLRTPLTAIRTAAELISRHSVADDGGVRIRSRAALIRRSVDSMERLIGDLLDVGAIEAGQLRLERSAHGLPALLEEVRGMLEGTAHAHGLTLAVELDEGLPEVSCDGPRVMRAVANLLGNAIKFTPSEGRVVLSARRDGSGGAVVAVTDTGVGISAEHQSHIFDRYWHSARSGPKALGLGLAIAKGIVEAHGSTLRVESREGEGSRFSFGLQAVSQVDTTARAELRAAPAPAPRAEETVDASLAARDAFISTASHELRTPLTALEVQIETLLRLLVTGRESGSSPRVKRTLESALKQTDRLTRLVENLLDVSSVTLGRFELRLSEGDLGEALESAVTECQGDAQAAGTRIHLETHPVPARFDRARMREVLYVLVASATKNSSGLPIEVSLHASRDAAHITVSGGGAFTAVELARMFQRYDQVVSTDRYAGLGIGLYLARHVVEAHGGTIKAEAADGRGTVFSIDLPRWSRVFTPTPTLGARLPRDLH